MPSILRDKVPELMEELKKFFEQSSVQGFNWQRSPDGRMPWVGHLPYAPGPDTKKSRALRPAPEELLRAAAAMEKEATDIDPTTGMPKTLFGIPVIVEKRKGTKLSCAQRMLTKSVQIGKPGTTPGTA